MPGSFSETAEIAARHRLKVARCNEFPAEGGGSSVALSNVTATLGRAYQNEASRDITCRCVVYVEASRQSQASHSVT